MTTIAEALNEAERSHHEAVDALREIVSPSEAALIDALSKQFLQVLLIARGLDVAVPF